MDIYKYIYTYIHAGTMMTYAQESMLLKLNPTQKFNCGTIYLSRLYIYWFLILQQLIKIFRFLKFQPLSFARDFFDNATLCSGPNKQYGKENEQLRKNRKTEEKIA